MNMAIGLQASYFKSLVQTAAARASRKQVVGFIFENRGTDGASNPVAQGLFLTMSTKPLINYPKGKNRCQKNNEVDKDQDRQFNSNHDCVSPQCNVTSPQFRFGLGLNFTLRTNVSAF